MRILRIASGFIGIALLCGLMGADRVDARVDVHVGVAVPPPPAVVFEHEPEVTVVPSTEVYYVPNQGYDLFRYHDVWYLNQGGYWYTARTYRGPFVAVAYERVPRPVIVTPAEFHHHPLRPPHAVAHARHRAHVAHRDHH